MTLLEDEKYKSLLLNRMVSHLGLRKGCSTSQTAPLNRENWAFQIWTNALKSSKVIKKISKNEGLLSYHGKSIPLGTDLCDPTVLGTEKLGLN